MSSRSRRRAGALVAAAAAAAGGAALLVSFSARGSDRSPGHVRAPTARPTGASTASKRRRPPPRANAFPPLVLHTTQSEHQDIAVLEYGKGPRSDIRLLIDGELQFSSVDEYRYHECLVHPALTLATSLVMPNDSNEITGSETNGLRVLLLGAGDGLAAREVLKHGEAVASVDIVDLDSAVTDLFRSGTPQSIPRLVQLCERAFDHEKVTLHSTDALTFLTSLEKTSKYDVIIMDLPDPVTEELARLYTVEFFSTALSALRQDTGGVLVTHGGDIFAKRASFWCLVETLRAAMTGTTNGKKTLTNAEDHHIATYSALVPSFGMWGFALACTGTLFDDATPVPEGNPMQQREGDSLGRLAGLLQSLQLPVECRFLSRQTMRSMFELPPDLLQTKISTTPQINLDAHPILHTLLQNQNIWAP